MTTRTPIRRKPRPKQAAVSRERVWPHIGYRPHAAQRKVHRSTARMRVVDAGRRMGKSETGGHELTVEALHTHVVKKWIRPGKRREFWIVGPEYSDSEKEFRVVYNDLKRLEVPFDHPGTYYNAETGQMSISLWDGLFQVHGKSAKYPGTLVGEGLNGVILSEAAKLKELVWTKYIRPTLADARGWALMTSTPEGKNWFYRAWQRGQDPDDKNWESWKFPSWCNPIVFPGGREDEEILDMQRDMSPEKFNQEVGADFTEFVGRVFKDFDEEIHVRTLTFDPKLPLYLAIDYGWTNPFVCLFIQVDVWDNVYVIGEYRRTNMDINDIAEELSNSRYGPLTRRAAALYPDPSEPGDTNVLARKLRVQVKKNTGGELKWRLELIRQALRPMPLHVPPDERRPHIYFGRTCTGLIQEMQDYRYPDTKEESNKEAPEEPLKKNDHAPEALGRFYRGYFGGPGDGGKAKTKVSQANLGG